MSKDVRIGLTYHMLSTIHVSGNYINFIMDTNSPCLVDGGCKLGKL